MKVCRRYALTAATAIFAGASLGAGPARALVAGAASADGGRAGHQGPRGGRLAGPDGPRGLSPEIVRTLNAHMNEILQMPDVAARMKVFGALPAGGDPARLAKTNAADHTRLAGIIKDFGIQAD